MVTGKATCAVFVYQGKGGGVDSFNDSEAAGEPANELSFAGAEIADQADDHAGLRGAAELLAVFQGFLRAAGAVNNHLLRRGYPQMARMARRNCWEASCGGKVTTLEIDTCRYYFGCQGWGCH